MVYGEYIRVVIVVRYAFVYVCNLCCMANIHCEYMFLFYLYLPNFFFVLLLS